MATATDCTLRMSRRYFSPEEEVKVELSVSFRLDETEEGSLNALVHAQMPILAKALELATHMALNDDYQDPCPASTGPDESDTMFEPPDSEIDLTTVYEAEVLEQMSENDMGTEEVSDDHIDREDVTEYPGEPNHDHVASILASTTDPAAEVIEHTINYPKQIVLRAEAKAAGIEGKDLSFALRVLYAKPSLSALTRLEGDDLLQRIRDGRVTRSALLGINRGGS